MFEATRNSDCRYCGSHRLHLILSLGEQPPSNSFISPADLQLEKKYPLDTYWCEDCYLVQLIDVVPAKLIFDDYHYLSSTSRALVEHYRQLTAILSERFALKEGDLVLDIGCNDGIMLNAYADPGLRKLGVEPSSAGEFARKAGLDVIKSFFDIDCAANIVASRGKPIVITATNVFAHVDRIDLFLQGVRQCLHEKGVFVVEASYLPELVDGKLFDTIYHEHLCYLALTPMVRFFRTQGMEIFDAEQIPFGASGPALRVMAGIAGNHPVDDRVGALLQKERTWGVQHLETYSDFSNRVERVKSECLSLIDRLLKDGKRLGGYGAPAKGNTLLNYLGITTEQVRFIAEKNQLKQGLLTPGSHIPIVSDEEFLEAMPDIALLLSWNYLDFFLRKSEYIQRGGKFLVPLPDPVIRPA